jgi:predicted nucleic acid-binding protein
MRQVFADTFYWIALASTKDEWHEEAKRLSTELAGAMLVTVEEVLIEFLTWFASHGPTGRAHAVATVRRILQDPSSHVIPETHEGFLAALELYEKRPDKQYSLTDCISMQTMRSLGITEVLTHDEHFTQEGFQVLFGKPA